MTALLSSDVARAFPTDLTAVPDREAKLACLRELHRHYMDFFVPPERSAELGEWTTPERVAEIEGAWNAYEEARVLAGPALPTAAADFRDWYFDFAAQHEYHDLCAYLRDQASLLDVGMFMLAEEKVDGRFDDIIALSQVGTTGVTKMTIAENFWDEMGNGDPAGVHTVMFDHSTSWFRREVVEPRGVDLGLLEQPEVYNNAVNLLMYGLRRRYALRSLAGIGLLEQTAPARFGANVAACRRLGVPQDVVRYQEVHVHVDEDHGREWFDHVFMSLLERAPETVHELALGVAIRGAVASEFYRRVQDVLFGLG
ncbi:MAG TPA: iron-containing redox enzyme family protein [Jatrophihabitans sp.]|uniref:iron-containing redox enzyme family protein n=1 Tax=Jatrophihabitans sp. TaxID=1932789 RepID=UPI002F23E61C